MGKQEHGPCLARLESNNTIECFFTQISIDNFINAYRMACLLVSGQWGAQGENATNA